ncbi:Glutamine-dependent NAD(+) synthetase [Methanoculleus chikugoensis]|jgi:NAD+ synthase (glutamine-hydrolysing)|uniref:Glutamine-dependent NAD(+) synthetase n=1 Tax=Methanoculleus chikugoensis TaxID=118126 RepID=A0A1M4MKZ2_9EURY|nr:NAD+ synthase [Methanoculleus chikugoensis]NMA10042.1 NAD+ synthase [Methanomicrobiales archaeon]SCL75611.1 Glutamine-dependent NAD(+) synthetase [Methanoculleus chikugoensis]
MKISLLQVNTVVGDLTGNADRIAAGVREASRHGPDLIVAPELSLIGCPSRDLLLQAGFITRSLAVLNDLAAGLADAPPVLVGFAEPTPAGIDRPLFNAAALLRDGEVRETFRKTSTSDGFDEGRYFEPAAGGPGAFRLGERTVAVAIGEEIPCGGQAPDAIVNLSASPFAVGRHRLREGTLSRAAKEHRVAIVSANLVGGNDDLVFAGRSVAFSADGTLIARGAAFAEDVVTVDLARPAQQAVAPDDQSPEAEIWQALVLGTRDYVHKCGFTSVHLGISGGIDSSLVAAVAARALGPENVLGVLLPSPHTSAESIEDARELAANLGIRVQCIPIAPMMEAFDGALAEVFAGLARDVTEENLQARIRATALMALANKFGSMLLSTGNKSEVAVGYSTLYGDAAGGLSVIADVPKGMVYRIARWMNAQNPVIPERVLKKPPSAELRPGQTDQEILPPYDLLDAILHRHIDCFESPDEIIAAGYPEETVREVARMVERAEFKRRQAPPMIKVTGRAFSTDWHMPIAAKPWWQ